MGYHQQSRFKVKNSLQMRFKICRKGLLSLKIFNLNFSEKNIVKKSFNFKFPKLQHSKSRACTSALLTSEYVPNLLVERVVTEITPTSWLFIALHKKASCYIIYNWVQFLICFNFVHERKKNSNILHGFYF